MTAPSDTVAATESLCPVCLARVPATRTVVAGDVCLVKECPEHGAWSTPIWRGSPRIEEWSSRGNGAASCCGISRPLQEPTRTGNCPSDCGLCPEHRQSTCTAVVDVTYRCNLRCPVCFADAGSDDRTPDLPAERVRKSLLDLFAAAGPVNLQFSGGEPTLRDDLPELVATAREIGFSFIQINSNGVRLSKERGYAEVLRDAGVASVFLQFDGFAERTWRTIRGRPLLRDKQRAIGRCAEAGLAVVLVPTVVPGVNDDELGSIVRYAAELSPAVRGVHFQPVSYFGRFPLGDQHRLTLPEILTALEEQTGGEVRPTDFGPSSCEHTLCSFRGRFWVRPGGRLEALAQPPASVAPPAMTDQPRAIAVDSAAQRAVAATSRQWGPVASRPGGSSAEPQDELDGFLEQAERILSISGMLFQDARSLDLERVRRCCVHALVPGRGRVPFCLWNVTSESGRRLYPRC